MNKKGQTLVIFVMLIPIILLLGALIVDNSIIVSENIRLKNTTKEIIKMDLTSKTLENEEILKLFSKNDIPIDNIKSIREENYLEIKNSYHVDSVFGKLISLNKYEVSVDTKGTLENGKVIYK